MSFIGNAQVEIDTDQLTHALQYDNNFFINYFLVNEITEATPVPPFHVDILNDMTTTQHRQYCCAIPRDHAKTTLAKLAVIKYLLFSKYRFILYVSNTSEIAAAAVNDIIGFLRSDNFTNYHRNVCGVDIPFTVEQTAHGFFRFVLFPGTDREKHCIIKALGAGKQVRGINVDNQRPELAVVDDLETNESLETELGFLKLKRWFYGPFKKALDKFGHKIIQLGNMISYNCMIREHTESKFWHSVRYGAILNNGQPLWPEAWPLDKLREDFAEYKSQGMLNVWMAEMMNMPIADGMGLIKEGEITYRPQPLPEELEFGFITVDPAISTKSWGHRTGVAVYGYVEPYWQVVETFADYGVDPLKLFDKIIELAYRWRLNVVGIEAVAYQASLKYVFQHFCLENHIEGMEFVDLAASARKTERFTAWAAEVKANKIAINDDDVLLTQQALFYDPTKKMNDCDLLDAAAYGPQMIQNYMHLIMQSYRGGKIIGGGNANLADLEGCA